MKFRVWTKDDRLIIEASDMGVKPEGSLFFLNGGRMTHAFATGYWLEARLLPLEEQGNVSVAVVA